MSQDKAKYADSIQKIGRFFPHIKVCDYYFKEYEIDSVSIKIRGFIPTITAKFTLNYSSPINYNLPKDGDLISVFMRPMTDFTKPLRCDFLINKIISTAISSYDMKKVVEENRQYTLIIKGELFIPNLYTEGRQKAYPGTSKKVLEQVAKEYKLGWAVTDQEDTQDEQVWYMFGQSLKDFLHDVSTHAWKDDTSFFDLWVDQFYNLTFSNQNKMLGKSKSDDGKIDLVKISVSTGTEMVDKNYNMSSENFDTYKLFSNLPSVSDSTFFVEKYTIDNKTAEIEREVGHVIEADFSINNQGLFNSGGQQRNTLRIEPCYNKEKLSDHVILRGRARDGWKNPVTGDEYADNEQSDIVRFIWNTDLHTMSDGDNRTNTNSNSGNTFKNYHRAYYHNKINNLEIEKLSVNLQLKGLNMALLKGEKVPVMLTEPTLTDVAFNHITSELKGTREYNVINMFYSGWFIITGLEYVYSKEFDTVDQLKYGSNRYRTIVTISRREWIPPENISPVIFDDEGNMIMNPDNDNKENPFTDNKDMKDKNEPIGKSGMKDKVDPNYYLPLQKTPQHDAIMREIAMFFRSNYGLNDTQIAGILGVMHAESRLKPSASNRAGAGGICQWIGSRKIKFTQIIGKAPEQASVEEQLRFVDYELTNTHQILPLIKQSTTRAEVADIWLRGYENGGGGRLATEKQMAGIYSKEMANRQGFANAYIALVNERIGFANAYGKENFG